MDAKSLLDQLMQGKGDVGAKAKQAWDAQSTGTKGALAGGLLGVLMGGRGGLGGLARVGGAALLGSLASKALADYKAGKSPLDAVTNALGLSEETAAEPSEDLAGRLLSAMVAAAKADGHVTEDEKARILEKLPTLGLTADATAMLEAELAKPLDVSRVAALAQNAQEAAQIYVLSLLTVGSEDAADQVYLADLADRLHLDAKLVEHLRARAASLNA